MGGWVVPFSGTFDVPYKVLLYTWLSLLYYFPEVKSRAIRHSRKYRKIQLSKVRSINYLLFTLLFVYNGNMRFFEGF